MNAADSRTVACEVCKSMQAKDLAVDFDGKRQNCPRCGEFKLTGSAVAMLMRKGVDGDKRALLSGWIRAQNNSGAIPLVSTNVLDSVFRNSVPAVAERAFSLLREAERGLTVLGGSFNINEPRFLAATYSADPNDVAYLVKALQEQGFMQFRALGGECEILPAGYMKLDELRAPHSTSSQGFIAMSFDTEFDSVYEHGFQTGVLKAGYNALRVDRVEHVNRIDDEIIRQINASRFVVADFTGHRGGVYFEAGYALGREIPVFWTCAKKDIGHLHFDIRQFNCIDWVAPQDLAERLTARLEAVLGPGPGNRRN